MFSSSVPNTILPNSSIPLSTFMKSLSHTGLEQLNVYNYLKGQLLPGATLNPALKLLRRFSNVVYML